jgi:hypothetical protein
MKKTLVLGAGFCIGLALANDAPGVTYSKDVAPILRSRCQECHRPGEVGPMPLLTYSHARPWAKAIRAAVLTKKMPPWFADPKYGHFRNDPSLSQKEIETIVAWVDKGAPEGDPRETPKPKQFEDGWNIGRPDAILEMPNAYQVPAKGTIDITYIIIPTGFTEDKWIQAAEVRPGNRAVVHHVNAIVQRRAANSASARAVGVPFTAAKVTTPVKGRRGQPTSEFLVGYVPGYQYKQWEPGQAKLIPAGADVLLQIHYSTNGTPGEDRTKVGLIFAKQPPRERVLSAVAKSWDFEIPAGAPNHELRSSVKFASDVTLVSLHPHMHYRGKDYEYRAVYPSGESELLMRVPRWDFNWQLTYFLKEPKLLPRGTRIECIAHYNNSPNNPFNPNPAVNVTYGEQTWDEMMSGWLEVAFDPRTDPRSIFDEAPQVASK